MPIYLKQVTPRQIAESVVCAVLDAAMVCRHEPQAMQQIKLADAVLDALKDCGIELVIVEHQGALATQAET